MGAAWLHGWVTISGALQRAKAVTMRHPCDAGRSPLIWSVTFAVALPTTNCHIPHKVLWVWQPRVGCACHQKVTHPAGTAMIATCCAVSVHGQAVVMPSSGWCLASVFVHIA
jgi:hypothetical protein